MRAVLTLLIGLALAAAGVLLNAAGGTDTDYEPGFSRQPAKREGTEYVLAVYPLHNSGLMFEQYNPLAEYLTSRMPGVRFRLEASRSHADFERKLYAARSNSPWRTPGRRSLPWSAAIRCLQKWATTRTVPASF